MSEGWAAFRADVEAMVGGGGLTRTIARAVVFPQVRAVAYYRAGHALARRGLLPLAYLLRSRALAKTGAEINPLAVIGPGFNLVHTAGVVIGPHVTIGARAWLFQGVTLGCGSRPGQPTIGDDVLLGAGAKVLGGVSIGDRAKVGANAVVTHDVPADATAVGMPAGGERAGSR